MLLLLLVAAAVTSLPSPAAFASFSQCSLAHRPCGARRRQRSIPAPFPPRPLQLRFPFAPPSARGTGRPFATRAGEQDGIEAHEVGLAGVERAAGGGKQSVDPVTYVFGRPGELSNDLQRLGTSPRRLILSSLGATGLALGANFAGVTDALVSLAPESSRAVHLDALYAIRGLRGYYTEDYALQYPKDWLFDQSVAQAQAYRREIQSRRVTGEGEWWDLNSDGIPSEKPSNVIPDAAFGPPKGGKYENLSVVKQRVLPVKSIVALLGEPQQALERLLSTSIAPEGSGKKAVIIGAKKRQGEEIYEFEYVLDLPNGRRIHTWSNAGLKQPKTRGPPSYADTSFDRYGRKGNEEADNAPELITMTLVTPEDESLTSKKIAMITRISQGFKLS